jgi:hypothetical protein
MPSTMADAPKLIADEADPLAKPRDAVGRAIMELQSFTGTAGSDEMKSVSEAIEWLGYAYSMLQSRSDNPAWSS